MLLLPGHTSSIIHVLLFVTLFITAVVSDQQTCQNAPATSPLLSDCYAALNLVPNNDALVMVPQNSASPHMAGSYGMPPSSASSFASSSSSSSSTTLSSLSHLSRELGTIDNKAIASSTCIILIRDFSPPGMKAVDPLA
ncbi:MAG: hypothetical protein Q9222_006814, partial [Ikaeria aurantiellina]